LHPAAAAAIEPELPRLAKEIVAAIQNEVPEYARPLRGEFGRGIRVGVEQALRRFIAAEEDGEVPSARLYRDLGRGEHRAGRSLDALQAAYRVGARVAWRRVSQLADGAGVPLGAQHDLAEAIFAYIDELAAESVEGYADAQAAEAGSIQRLREELLMLLIAEPPATASALEEAAARARWRLPQWIALIAVEGAHAARVARRLSGDVLYATDDVLGRIAVPDPSRARPELEAAARRYRAAVGLGPTVPLGEAGRSARWATLAMRQASVGTAVAAEAQLATLLIKASPDIATRLREGVLLPLRDESETSRARLEVTLLAWLRHQGSQAAIAAELGVHPQTVRYRMRRLRELFGPDLQDPDKRFELELALRASS
jgi:DNA-binding CsgD family transcriptional regulator